MKKKASEMSYRFMGDSYVEAESSTSGNKESKDREREREKLNKLKDKFG